MGKCRLGGGAGGEQYGVSRVGGGVEVAGDGWLLPGVGVERWVRCPGVSPAFHSQSTLPSTGSATVLAQLGAQGVDALTELRVLA